MSIENLTHSKIPFSLEEAQFLDAVVAKIISHEPWKEFGVNIGELIYAVNFNYTASELSSLIYISEVRKMLELIGGNEDVGFRYVRVTQYAKDKFKAHQGYFVPIRKEYDAEQERIQKDKEIAQKDRNLDRFVKVASFIISIVAILLAALSYYDSTKTTSTNSELRQAIDSLSTEIDSLKIKIVK